MITIIQESLITFRRNTDHDHPGIAITIVRESLITIPRNPHTSCAPSGNAGPGSKSKNKALPSLTGFAVDQTTPFFPSVTCEQSEPNLAVASDDRLRDSAVW